MNTPSPATKDRPRSWVRLILWAAVVFAALVALLLWTSKPPPGPPIVASPPVGRLYFLMVDRDSEHTAALRGLYTLAAGGKKPGLVLEEEERQTMDDTPRQWISFPRVSPDGKYLAYVSTIYLITEETRSEDVQLDVLSLTGAAKPKVLLDLSPKKMNAGGGIAWTPKTDQIAFLSDGNLIEVDPVTDHFTMTGKIDHSDATYPEIADNGSLAYLSDDDLFQATLSKPNSAQRTADVQTYALSSADLLAYVAKGAAHEVVVAGKPYKLEWSEPWYFHGGVTSLGFSPDGKYLGYTVTNAIVPEEGFYYLRLSDGKCFRLPYSTSRAGWDWAR